MPRPNPSNHPTSPSIRTQHNQLQHQPSISIAGTSNAATVGAGCVLLLLLALTASMTQLPSKVFYAVFGFLSRRRQRRQPPVEWRMNDQNVSKTVFSLLPSHCLCSPISLSFSFPLPLESRLNRCAVTGQKIFA